MAPSDALHQLRLEVSPLVRVVGRDLPATQVMVQVAERELLPVQIRPGTVGADDYTQIDPTLNVLEAAPEAYVPPKAGTGYAGFTPQQRHWFLTWLNDPKAAAPPALQQLYVAHLEVALFDEDIEIAAEASRELITLQTQPTWQESVELRRANQLNLWLSQKPDRIASWLGYLGTTPDLLGVALGQFALLQGTLDHTVAMQALNAWRITTETPASDVLQLRLASLATNLGAEPLAYALAQLDEAALAPQPWRSVHRDIRIALPQPDLRAILEPLLREIAAMADTQVVPADEDEYDDNNDSADEAVTADDLGWHLVLEFGQSRSEFFDYTLEQARKRPGYSQLMDENRKIVYRVIFRKRELRHFWRLWEYVKSWSETHVYVNGKEVKKWDVYPHSPHMR